MSLPAVCVRSVCSASAVSFHTQYSLSKASVPRKMSARVTCCLCRSRRPIRLLAARFDQQQPPQSFSSCLALANMMAWNCAAPMLSAIILVKSCPCSTASGW